MSLFTRIGCRNVFGFRQFAGSQKRKCQGFSWMENAPLEERLLLTAQLSKIQLAADDPSDVTTTDISVISPAPVDYMSQLKSKALACNPPEQD